MFGPLKSRSGGQPEFRRSPVHKSSSFPVACLPPVSPGLGVQLVCTKWNMLNNFSISPDIDHPKEIYGAPAFATL